MTQKKILCIGAVMADVVCHIPRLPQRGEGVVVTERAVHLGGCAFNSGNIVRQLGQPCLLMAPIGRGLYADFVRGELASRGLEAIEVKTTLDCGCCTCYVEPDGERTMVTSPGIERCFEESWFDLLDAQEYSVALAAGYEIEGPGGEAIIAFLEKNPHIEFVYAPGPRVCGVAAERMERIKALHPMWHLNDLELLSYTGASTIDEGGARLAAECENVVIVTMGKEGCAVFFPDGTSLTVPTDTVVPVDTVGAGDTHLGALIAARHAGLGWEEALAVANKASGAVCCVQGGTLSDAEFAALGLSLA